MPTFLRLCLMTALVLCGLVPPAVAQGQFSPAIKVNEEVITRYELDQRARMLRLFRAPGDPREEAETQLVEDRLRLQAAKQLGITPSEEEIVDGMNEFAGRANLTGDQFLKALAQGGIAAETFRDFVRAGVAWRQVVRARFAPKINISETEIDRAIANGGGGGPSLHVQLGEIFLPISGGEAEARALADRIRSGGASGFAAAARQYSAAPTAQDGGMVNWVPASTLAPEVRDALQGLRPGQISQPVRINNQIAIFLLRALDQRDTSASAGTAIEYAAYYMAGGRSEQTLAQAAKIKARVNTCDDLYGVAKGQPAEVLERGVKSAGEIPADIAAELTRLDPGEVSTNLTRANGQTLVFLMLCDRSADLSGAVSREGVALNIQNRRLGAYADGYLEQLKSEARIVRY